MAPSPQSSPRSLFEKIWDAHVILVREDGAAVLHVDRHVLHDLGAKAPIQRLEEAGRRIHSPGLLVSTQDHIVSSAPGRTDLTYAEGTGFSSRLRASAARHGFRLFPLEDPRQGIVHVIAPELGVTLPGVFLVCGDSHTCTNGGVGAMAMGLGSSEVEHVLATQTLVVRKPRTLRITLTGTAPPGVSAKDFALHIISSIGVRGGVGHAIEYAGPAVQALDVEGRLTLCNMSIECGARVGMVAPDEKTFAWLKGRAFAPKGDLWDQALASWRALPSDPGARFDREVTLDISTLQPQVTWGTMPEQALSVGSVTPDPVAARDDEAREAVLRALAYMDLRPGQPLRGVPIDVAFIGSCTNSRIDDLRAAADVVRGRRVAAHVRAMVVPGSSTVKRQAEAEGLADVFRAAGFEWRESACSMCAAANEDRVESGRRAISTSNRNFEGRQGPGSRTHLASPQTVAASAIAGHITDAHSLAQEVPA